MRHALRSFDATTVKTFSYSASMRLPSRVRCTGQHVAPWSFRTPEDTIRDAAPTFPQAGRRTHACMTLRNMLAFAGKHAHRGALVGRSTHLHTHTTHIPVCAPTRSRVLRAACKRSQSVNARVIVRCRTVWYQSIELVRCEGASPYCNTSGDCVMHREAPNTAKQRLMHKKPLF